MNVITRIFSRLFQKRHLPNNNSGIKFDEQYNDTGVFHYNENGFTVHYKDFFKRLDWTEITQLNVYKVDQMTFDTIEMLIVYGEKSFTINEELPGWYQFVLKTKDVFPSIPKDWDIEIIHPAFETNYTTIYDKMKLEEKQNP